MSGSWYMINEIDPDTHVFLKSDASAAHIVTQLILAVYIHTAALWLLHKLRLN